MLKSNRLLACKNQNQTMLGKKKKKTNKFNLMVKKIFFFSKDFYFLQITKVCKLSFSNIGYNKPHIITPSWQLIFSDNYTKIYFIKIIIILFMLNYKEIFSTSMITNSNDHNFFLPMPPTP